MKLSIVIPCFNEEENLVAIVERLNQVLSYIENEIIIIDDGSHDGTIDKFNLVKKNYSNIHLIQHSQNLGIAAAWKSGVKMAKGDLVCLIDADLQNPPEAIPGMLSTLISEQVDFVQGVRSSIGRLKDQRLLISRLLNFLLNLIFQQSARDSKSGFVLGYREVFLDLFNYKRKYFHFQTFIGVVVRSKGYRVIEYETLFESRELGKSFISDSNLIKVILQVIFDFPKAVIEFRKRDFRLSTHMSTEYKFKQDGFLAKFLFHFYFATMGIHKWIITNDSKKMYYFLKFAEFQPEYWLKTLQQERLRRLLIHSYHNVPYYRNLFRTEGLEVSDLVGLERIPLLSKDDVRKNIHFSMFSSTHVKREMIRIQTSGSTGQPFVCYADRFQLEMRLASTLRALEMTGWKFGKKQVRLWHQTLGMTRKQALQEKLDALILRRTFIPAFEMTKQSVVELLKLISKKKPYLVDGYAESLNFVAKLSTSYQSNKYRPVAVMSSAQQLTESTKNVISENFCEKIFDKYGSREFSGIAYQCELGGNYHVQDESYIVEILVDGRAAKPGEYGEVVITDLNNFSVPLIRYRIGDLALAVEQTPCKCGRSHSQIGTIIGRTQALIACSNGVWLPGTFFSHFFKEFEYAVSQYQIYQDRFGEFTVRVLPTSRFNTNIQERILQDLQSFTSTETMINFELVESIPMEKTGKRTPVISRLSHDFQDSNPNVLYRIKN